MTENPDLHDKVMSVVKEYVASEEFNGKIKSFTKKTVQETVSCVWKYWVPVLAVISLLVVWIFLSFKATIEEKLSYLAENQDRLANNQVEIIKIIAKLEERTK